MFIEGIYPAGLARINRISVPEFLEIIVFRLADRDDSIAFVYCIDGEIASVLRKGTWFDTNGTALCVTVKSNDTVGDGK